MGGVHLETDTEDIIRYTSILAVLASMFVILSYLRFPSLQKRSLELVALLAFSQMLANIACMMNTDVYNQDKGQGQQLCFIQGVVMQFTNMAVWLWCLMITGALYSIVVLKDEFLSRDVTHAIVWGVSAAFCFPALLLHKYGPAGAWCWIKASEGSSVGWALRFGTSYLPCALILVGCAVLVFKVHLTMRRLSRLLEGANWEPVKAIADNLMYYPVIALLSKLNAKYWGN
jgi:hypothetical protein